MESPKMLRKSSGNTGMDSGTRSAGSPIKTTPIEAKNPLSLRLYKLLGARYDDPSTREAIEILSTLYAPAPPSTAAGTIRPRRNTVRSRADGNMSDDSDEERPTALPSSIGIVDRDTATEEVAARARKNLRKDMEDKLAQSSRMFLAAFSEINQNLDILQQQVEAMQIQCDTAQEQLQTTNEACKHLLERADGLRVQRQTVTTRQAAIAAFLSRFTLTEAENEALTSSAIPIGPKVFSAIDRCEGIRADCLLLASVDGGETRAGAEIKALTDSNLDMGYEKLFLWIQDEFRLLARDIHAEPSPTLRESVRRLRRRPALFNEALGSLSLTRQNTLLSFFLAALTKGAPGGYPRPIELHAHEPTRYVGDMLAWIHQATAGEREFLDSIFEVTGDGRMMGSVRVFEKDSEKEEEGYIRELLDSNLEKLCTPLRVRVQQTIRSQEGSITSYKITNLLQFYQTIMKRTIGEDALMSETLKEITETSYKVFLDTLRAHGRSLLRFLHAPEADLAPPLALRESCMILREIMQVYDSSLLEDETPEQRVAGFMEVLEGTVGPMLTMCSTMANMIKPQAGQDSNAWDRATFMINCLVYIESVLQPFNFTVEKLQALESSMDDNVQVIVEAHFEEMLTESGLAPIMTAINDPSGEMPLARVQGCSSQNVSVSLQAFDSFLSSLDVLTSPSLSLLSLPRLGTLIHRTALERVARAYGKICQAIRDPKNKYEFSGTLLGSRRPFGQMSVLLQVLGLDTLEDEA